MHPAQVEENITNNLSDGPDGYHCEFIQKLKELFAKSDTIDGARECRRHGCTPAGKTTARQQPPGAVALCRQVGEVTHRVGDIRPYVSTASARTSVPPWWYSAVPCHVQRLETYTRRGYLP